MMNASVVVVPYQEAREALVEATIKRRKRQTELQQEERKLQTEVSGMTEGGSAPDLEQLENAISSAREAVELLADRARLYYESVATGSGAGLPLERLEQFQKKLAPDELQTAAGKIAARNLVGTEEAMQKIREILSRDAWSGKDVTSHRDLARNALQSLEETLRKTPKSALSALGATARTGTDPRELAGRILAHFINLYQTKDPLVMFSALPSATIKGQTDPDGRCTIQIPPTGRWVIGVCYQRPANDPRLVAAGIRESFCWIEEIQPSDTNLSLTDNNLLRPAIAPLRIEHDLKW